MNSQGLFGSSLRRSSLLLATLLIAGVLTVAAQANHSIFVLTSTNSTSGNDVVVFQLDTTGTPELSMVDMLPTGGKGGASSNAGILQFSGQYGAVANYGSNTVTQLMRDDTSISIGKTINMASGCTNPDSVALTKNNLFVVGANCAESHAWPDGSVDGSVVHLSDPSAAQIAAGTNWAAVTLTSGSVLQLPLTAANGVLSGTSTSITLPGNANSVPLGAAFWDNILGFTPAHSPDSFAIVDRDRSVSPIVGPSPPYPANAPCWVAKGPASIWYTGNSPGKEISLFFSNALGGDYYKSAPLPGVPTDITVSADEKWLAVIFTAGSEAYVSVFAVDEYGDLFHVATSSSIGVASFNGVAISD